MELDIIFEQITSLNIFIRLKNVVENYDGFHDNEDVYSHSIKTANIAKKQLSGDFITNLEAKQNFYDFINEKTYGIPRKNILILAALLHDCGKLLSYSENGSESSLITPRVNFPSQTICPGHEYYGGTIVVGEILKDIDIDQDAKKYIATLVRLHDALNNFTYYTQKQNWPLDSIISDIKSRAEGFYIETMFNGYCDCYSAAPFHEAKEMIEKIFNKPELYTRRVYFIK